MEEVWIEGVKVKTERYIIIVDTADDNMSYKALSAAKRGRERK